MRSLLCLTAIVASVAGAAEPPRLVVAALHAPPELTYTGKSLADGIAAQAKALGGAEVLGPEAVERRLGRAANADLVRCAADARCLADAAKPLEPDRIVGGWLARDGDRYRVTLVQVDARTGARLAVVQRDVPVATRRLRQEVLAAAPALLAGRADATGTLVVRSSVPGALVTIDDVPAGTTPLTRALSPGRHKVQVAKDGYLATVPAFVDVPAGGRTEHAPRLYEIPARERGNGARAATADTRVDVVR